MTIYDIVTDHDLSIHSMIAACYRVLLTAPVMRPLLQGGMSCESEEQALKDGQQCAMSVMAALGDTLAKLPPAEQIHWWMGFFGVALGGGSTADKALMLEIAEALAERGDTVPLNT